MTAGAVSSGILAAAASAIWSVTSGESPCGECRSIYAATWWRQQATAMLSPSESAIQTRAFCGLKFKTADERVLNDAALSLKGSKDMTRITGSTIIACPVCGKEYRTSAYGSINLTGMEEWSDGFVYGLYFSKPDVCICDCGALFLRAKARTVGFVPQPEPEMTAEQEANLPDFLRVPAFRKKDED